MLLRKLSEHSLLRLTYCDESRQSCDIALVQAANRKQLLIIWVILSSSNFYKDKDRHIKQKTKIFQKRTSVKHFQARHEAIKTPTV